VIDIRSFCALSASWNEVCHPKSGSFDINATSEKLDFL